MSARSYIRSGGIIVEVEVDGATDTRRSTEAELRRIYGTSYRLGRWIRHGKRRRAEVVQAERGSRRVSQGSPNWFEVRP